MLPVQRIFKKIIAFTAAAFMLSNVPAVSAKEAYDTYNYDRWGEAIPSKSGYAVSDCVSGSDLDIGEFSSPSDIFRMDKGLFYIADSGNNRIVVVNEDFTKAEKILSKFTYKGETLTLKAPKSIFVSGDTIYIADTENSRILRSDDSGNVDLIIEKPSSELYTAVTFLPQKVIVDKAGFVYVTVNNITSGAVMYDCNGNFTGFYGANRVQQTSEVLRNYFWKFFSNEMMRRYMTNSVPAPITSFDIDDDGFIYTCSNSLTQDVDAVKKVNAAGFNLFADLDVSFGDRPTADYSDTPKNSYVDIDIDENGFINCLDFTNGRIFQYDEDCNLLFIFGGTGYQKGTFKQVSAIESSTDRIYVADLKKNTVTIFKETSFGESVHTATELYNDGYYDEALEPWFDVLKQDGNYRRAYIGISSAYINQGRYKEAMKYAKLADSQRRYNKAFEGWRTEFINKNFNIFAVIILLIAIVIIILIYRKKKGLRSVNIIRKL